MVMVFGGITARHIILYRDRDDIDRGFALLWLFASGLWFFAGLRLIFYGLGWNALDRAVFYVVQIFVIMHILPGVLHTVLKITKNRRVLIVVMSVATALAALFGFFIFYDGVKALPFSNWGSEYVISDRAFLFFMPAFVFLAFGNIFDLARKLFHWRTLKSESLEHTLASIAILIYISAGVFDLKGIAADWGLLIERAAYMTAALISYIGYTWDTDFVLIEDGVERRGH
jgi:hypothetical protein